MGRRDHKFTVLGKKYTLGLDDELEEVFRMAERELNRRLIAKAGEKIDGYNDRDYLSLVALQVMAEALCLQHDNTVEPDTEAIAALIEKIESKLK